MHHHHGGAWSGQWQGYLPYDRFGPYYWTPPQVEVIETAQPVVPTWALVTGLGLLAIVAFKRR